MRQSSAQSSDRGSSGPIIVSVQLSPESKAQLDYACEQRGMTIKTLLGRLIGWFVSIDKTEQSIVLQQVEDHDIKSLAEMVIHRKARGVVIESDLSAALKAAANRKPRGRRPNSAKTAAS